MILFVIVAARWLITDGEHNILPPVITIKRGAIVKGDYSGVKWNIPGMPKFVYQRVPTFENGLYGYDLYKIPQPYAVNIAYEVRFVARYSRDINKFVQNLLKAFAGDQFYINVKGYYTRYSIESTELSDNLDELESDRLFIMNIRINASGYLQDERNFEVTKAYNRVMVAQEIQGEQFILPPLLVSPTSSKLLTYYQSGITLNAYTPLTIQHNLGLADRDAFVFRLADASGNTIVLIDNTSLDVNSFTLESKVTLTGLYLFVMGSDATYDKYVNRNIDLLPYTPLTIQHNLGLVDPQAFIFRLADPNNGYTIFLDNIGITDNSLTLESFMGVNGIKLYIIGMSQVSKKYFASGLTITANTPLVINHNLNLSHKDSFVLRLSDSTGEYQPLIETKSIDVNSFSILTNTTLSGYKLFVMGV